MKWLIILVIGMILAIGSGLLAMWPVFGHNGAVILLLSLILACNLVHAISQERWWQAFGGAWMESETKSIFSGRKR